MSTKKELLRQFAQNKEEELLIGRLLDLAERSETGGYAVYSRFLTPHQRSLAMQVLPQAGYFPTFDGGYDDAERAVAAFLPEYENCPPREEASFPVKLLRAEIPGAAYGRGLTHRDFLGALMGLRIERELVGDIRTDENGAYLFVLEQAVPVLMGELTKVGSKSVQLTQVPLHTFDPGQQERQELKVFVASLRLDSIVAEGFGLSRTKAAEAIRSGAVSLQHAECLRPAAEVAPGDTIALRGSGRLTVGEPGGISRKGRQSLTLYLWK